MAKYKKNDKADFVRNSAINKKKSTIISVVESPSGNVDQTYIIEHDSGWIPNPMRIQKFGLNENKKYLFVKEQELKKLK